MKKFVTFGAAAALAASAAPAFAQQATPQNPLQSILGAIFGDRLGAANSLEGQWSAGRTPLTTQQAQFNTRVDSEVSARAFDQATGIRLKSDYAALVELERRYAADGRFTTAERTDLSDRYGALTQVLADRGYTGGSATMNAEVAAGQAEFNRRVDASVAARRLTRTAATRLKADYAALITTENSYLRDGVLSAAERNDLDARLDALDARVGDVAYSGATLTASQRLDAVARALSTSGLTRAQQTQLLIEHGDLVRLESAYSRLSVSAEERAYLDRRLGELETRVRLR
jgi:hypothetical protein